MGDILQFSKFLINLLSSSKKIDFVIFDKLLPIFKSNFNNINIYKKSEILENKYDYKISIGSLNKYFYKDNNSNSSDLINLNSDKKDHSKFFLNNKKKNIGLVWSGNFLVQENLTDLLN